MPPYPYPDALHLIVLARASERAADEWTDVEGWETSSAVMPLDAVGELDPLCKPFLELLITRASAGAS